MINSEKDAAMNEWKVRSLQHYVDELVRQQGEITLRTIGIDQKTVDPNQRGWLKITRFAAKLSTNEIARRLGISRPAYSRAEARELRGGLTIATMRRLSDAMNCDFVYELRPREGNFVKKIWIQVCPLTIEHPRFWRRSTPVSPREFASIAEREVLKPSTRGKLQWTERLWPK